MRHQSFQTDVKRGALSPAAQMKESQCNRIAELREQLVQCGFATLDAQAAALGLVRSTCWAVLRGAHKASGLSSAILKRMLGSPQLPNAVRLVILKYIDEKCQGLYGHSGRGIERFREQFLMVRAAQLVERPSPSLAGAVDVERHQEAAASSVKPP